MQWIEVDQARLGANLRSLRELLPESAQLAPVLKSNAYGHGLSIAARAFADARAQWFCVHSLSEAEALNDLDLRLPILILGPLDREELSGAVEQGFHCTVYDPDRLRELAETAELLKKKAKIHLKIETGTWRQGVAGAEFLECLGVIKERQSLTLEGLHSHYANIEDTTEHSYAEAQNRAFEDALATVTREGLRSKRIHMSCSAAAILFPNRHMDLARIGISAYGYWPSAATQVSANQKGRPRIDLAPALKWKVKVAQVKMVPAGSYIGYGCTDKVEIDTRLAVLPVGYADGYGRQMSGQAHILLHGRRCPVRGRICMNLMMVDVSHLPQVAVGDEAVLLGRQGEEEIDAETLAGWAGTIHYEILARLRSDLPRIAL